MKKILYAALILVTGFCFNQAKAQVNTAAPQRVYKTPKLDEHSMILDSAGKKLDYTVWNNLVATGRYDVKVVVNAATGKGSLRMVKLSKAERDLKVAQMPKPAESPYFVTGEALKQQVKERDFTGELWDTKRLKGKIVVLSFWYVNNVNCRMQIPDLNELATTYKNDPDVVFLSVAMDDKKTVEEFLQYNPFGFKHLEKGKYISDKMGVITHPTDVVIDKAGKVQYHTTGYSVANPYWMAKTIEQLKVPVTQEILAVK